MEPSVAVIMADGERAGARAVKTPAVQVCRPPPRVAQCHWHVRSCARPPWRARIPAQRPRTDARPQRGSPAGTDERRTARAAPEQHGGRRAAPAPHDNEGRGRQAGGAPRARERALPRLHRRGGHHLGHGQLCPDHHRCDTAYRVQPYGNRTGGRDRRGGRGCGGGGCAMLEGRAQQRSTCTHARTHVHTHMANRMRVTERQS